MSVFIAPPLPPIGPCSFSHVPNYQLEISPAKSLPLQHDSSSCFIVPGLSERAFGVTSRFGGPIESASQAPLAPDRVFLAPS